MTQPDANAVAAYFSSRASEYSAGWDGWLGRAVRARESGAVGRALPRVQGRTVLELGAGDGFYTRVLLAGGAALVVAVDLCAEMLAGLPSEGVEPVQADVTSLALDRRFEVVLSAGMLEFVSDPAAALAAARRHVEPSGTVVLLVPTDNVLGRAYQAWHRRHGLSVHLFDREQLEALATGAGLALLTLERVWPFATVASLRAM